MVRSDGTTEGAGDAVEAFDGAVARCHVSFARDHLGFGGGRTSYCDRSLDEEAEDHHH